MSIDAIQPPLASTEIKNTEFPGLQPDLHASFNLEPGAFYKNENQALELLNSLPFVPAAKIDKTLSAVTSAPDIQFPVERLVSATRPMINWAANGEQKLKHDGRQVSSIENALWFARSGNYKNQLEPIRVALFADNSGEVWGRVEEGISRTIAAKLAGEIKLPVVLSVPDDISRIDRYAGEVIAESDRRRFYDSAKLSKVAVQAMITGRDMRDLEAEQASDAAWDKWQQ